MYTVEKYDRALPSYQQRGSPLRKYFIPGCVGKGLDLDLRVRPAAAQAAAPGNQGICPLGIEVAKIWFSKGLAHNRSKVSVINSQNGFVHINFSRSIFPYMQSISESG